MYCLLNMVAIMSIRAFLVLALYTATAPAFAQEAMLAPSPYLECMAPTAGSPTAPAYPEHLLEAKTSARISVEIEFSGPDAAPGVRIAQHPYDAEFNDAIKRYARNLRLPCMPAGAKPVVLTQRYVFNPTDGRKAMPPQTEDAAHLARQDMIDCLKHVKGQVRIQYPREALRQVQQGKVMARMRFTNATEPPKVSYLAEIGGKEFRNVLDPHLAGQRLTCMKPGDGPIDIDITYIFTIEGEYQTSFKDMPLQSLLGIVKTPPPISADFGTMGCPFDVRLRYLQPYTLNQVVEVETTNTARRPLLEWLRKLELNVKKDLNDRVFADQFTVSIPCGRIEL